MASEPGQTHGPPCFWSSQAASCSRGVCAIVPEHRCPRGFGAPQSPGRCWVLSQRRCSRVLPWGWGVTEARPPPRPPPPSLGTARSPASRREGLVVPGTQGCSGLPLLPWQQRWTGRGGVYVCVCVTQASRAPRGPPPRALLQGWIMPPPAPEWS